MTEEEIREGAIEFAKKNKIRIAKELTDIKKYLPDSAPVSVFMAGSPGAGKTEFSERLVENFEKNREHRVVRIDGDDVRASIPGYTGTNSYLFQGAVSLVVEKIHDFVLHNNQSFVLDGTFSKYEKAVENIKRSLAKSRPVFIIYVYQKPEVAWKFTQAREKLERRNIPKEAFMNEFLGSRKTVGEISAEFKEKVTIFLIKKDFEKNTRENYLIDKGKEQIDQIIQDEYTRENLEELL
jgi:adenylylsulfate kinase-like enzyme